MAAAFDAAATLASAIGACSDAVVKRITLRYGRVPEVRPEAIGEQEIIDGASFAFTCGTQDIYALIHIPAFKSEFIATSGNGAGVLVSLDATEVAAFIAVASNGSYSNPFADVITDIDTAYRQDRP